MTHPIMKVEYRDGRRFCIKQADAPMDYWAGVGVELVIAGKVRRHAVEFDTRKVGTLSDDRLLAMGKPILEEWIAEENSKSVLLKVEQDHG